MTVTTNKKIYKVNAETIEKVSKNIYFIEFKADDEVKVLPGQFISVYCEGLTFRRPFSVYSNNGGKMGILFKERGKGTKYIKSLRPGDKADIAGPFGNGFDIKNKRTLLIGGGIGTAPVAFLKSVLDEKNIENRLMAGFLTRAEIPNVIKCDELYTDDGSEGIKGSVINRLDEVIKEYSPEVICACAPLVVLKLISEKGMKYGIETYVAMEKVMACGIGVCRGCVIGVKRGETVVNASICKDGPVFDAKEIVWEKVC